MTSGQAISKLKHDKKYDKEIIIPLEKEHKAIQFIKKYQINVADEIMLRCDYQDYLEYSKEYGSHWPNVLSKKEWELLKDIFHNYIY